MKRDITSICVRKVANYLAITAGILLVWSLLVPISGISSFVAKTPLDIWGYLFQDPASGQNRAAVLAGLRTTLFDASVGYLAGLGGAVVIALIFVAFPAISFTFTPLAMVLRTFPLIALTPLIILIFGRDLLGIAAIGFIVVFFSALLTISFGLRSATKSTRDVVTVFGGNRWDALSKVAIPGAIPAFFTAARIAVPQALSAALIAEWLVTGSGAGAQLLQAAGTSKYLTLWSVATVFILATCLIYTVVSMIEEIVLHRVAGVAQ